jgi:NADH:ubiquinone oxidoreductase 24 kD subunit
MKEFIKENQEKLEELKGFINEHNDKNNLILILHKAQEIFGYLPKEVQKIIAEELSIPVSKVYGVVTFYSFFKTESKGKYTISVCMGTACFVKGADKLLEEFEKILNIKSGETTEDGKFTIDSLRCVGACGLAPVVTINGKVYGKVTRDQVKEILKEYE